MFKYVWTTCKSFQAKVVSQETFSLFLYTQYFLFCKPVAEFKEFEPRFKSAKTRFKFSADLNLVTFDTILSGTNHL